MFVDEAGGTSLDWAKQVIGARYAYTIELPPSLMEIESTKSCFDQPASRIAPTGIQLYAGLLAIVQDDRVRTGRAMMATNDVYKVTLMTLITLIIKL